MLFNHPLLLAFVVVIALAVVLFGIFKQWIIKPLAPLNGMPPRERFMPLYSRNMGWRVPFRSVWCESFRDWPGACVDCFISTMRWRLAGSPNLMPADAK